MSPMRVFLAGLTLVMGCASVLGGQGREQSVASFSMILESADAGWSARCDSGCHWREVTLSCEGQCSAIVDAYGVGSPLARRSEDTPFAFRIEHMPNGVRAHSLGGTAWMTLSWTCVSSPCRARINENGMAENPVRR
jgi:hypothetical protein